FLSTRLTRGHSAGHNSGRWFGAPTHRCPGSGHAPPPRAHPPGPRSTARPDPGRSHDAHRDPGVRIPVRQAGEFPSPCGRRTPMTATRRRGAAASALFLALAGLAPGTAAAQPTADQQAAEILNAGRKAYADANPQFAAEKFREFLTKFG